MLNVIVVAAIVICSLWVYLDARGKKIGKVAGAGGMFNMSAGAWSVVTLLLWIIGFPAYLIKRSSLIKRASEHPVEVKRRVLKAVILGVIGTLWAFLTFADSLTAPPA